MPYRLARDLRPLRRPLLPDRLLGRAPSTRSGSAPTTSSRTGWAPWSTRTPGCAGGHNGLSNSEDPQRARAALPARARAAQADARDGPRPRADRHGRRRLASRATGRTGSAIQELGPIAFQFGTRPLLTRESPIPEGWKKRLLELLPGDVLLHRFSPTGFYSSAVKNRFLDELVGALGPAGRVRRGADPSAAATASSPTAARATASTAAEDMRGSRAGSREGYTQPMRTPDDTLIFVAPQKAREIRRDQANCMGCLSHCKFSNWTGSRRPHDRQARRPALVLHPEDPAGDRPRRAARPSTTSSCSPATTSTVPPGSVLRQRLRADGQAAGAAHPDRPLTGPLDKRRETGPIQSGIEIGSRQRASIGSVVAIRETRGHACEPIRIYSPCCSGSRSAGLRPTRQRLALAKLLLESGPRHVTAEELFQEARNAGIAGLARDRLQHAAPVHLRRAAARGRGRHAGRATSTPTHLALPLLLRQGDGPDHRRRRAGDPVHRLPSRRRAR